MKQEKFSLLCNFHQVLLLNQLHLPPWKKLTMRTLMPGLLLVRTLWKPKMFRKKLLTKQVPLRLQFQQLQVRIQKIRPLYDVKWVLFKWIFCHVKVLSYPYPSDMSEPISKPFKWGTLWNFISRFIRNTSCQTFDFPNLLNKRGLSWHYRLWLLVSLMPLEVKLQTVSHFKALNSD